MCTENWVFFIAFFGFYSNHVCSVVWNRYNIFWIETNLCGGNNNCCSHVISDVSDTNSLPPVVLVYFFQRIMAINAIISNVCNTEPDIYHRTHM